MQHIDIAVRAYVRRTETAMSESTPDKPKKEVKRKSDMPSEWTLVLDAETVTDPSQKLRFGTYQIRKGEDLMESGIFYDSGTLSKAEQKTLQEYAEAQNLKFLSVTEFIEDVFYLVGYAWRASIVGFNLPFDISRLAIDHAPARVTKRNNLMQGGFSFQLSKNAYQPRVQIKHVSPRMSFIQFAAIMGQRTAKGDRKKQRWQPVRRGYFLDIKTLAAALTSTSHSLASLAKYLNVTQKYHTEEHGSILTPEYIAYALQDTQVTWECFCKLKSLYALHSLDQTGAHKIHSEASLGKAYLHEMGIKPWKKLQPDFPPEIIGNIMSAYYGGRSEVHIRREVVQVLYCDFLSMYPTVCTLMGLWRFVTAQGMTQQDTTAETREFLEKVIISDLQRQETWQGLSTIVQVMPDDDIFPVRAKYGDVAQHTIGSNYLTSKTPLWFTLADCISSKLLTGRAPKILKAVSFTPKQMQDDLMPVNIAGKEECRVSPCEGDFFKQIIDLRTTVKKQIKSAAAQNKPTLENQQLALKILANATSYGIFVEFNTEEEKLLQPMLCYGANGSAIPIRQKKFEATGAFFHPLLATLITGAARLMLAITERQAIDTGLDWAFCDTDSMALARPEAMSQEEFYTRAQQVREWFTRLNPYTEKAPLLKIEDCNYSLLDGNMQPLYCYAVSSKRYALFNIDAEGKIVLRKVSAHGLGHLVAPYQRKDESDLEDVQPWQQDLWREIINAACEKRPPDFSKLQNFNMPALSRYGATTPALEKWFKKYNENKPYCDRLRPFNFLSAMQATHEFKSLKPVAPYNKDTVKAVARCFDRVTGEKVSKNQLKTNLDALAQYHLHRETKFLNGDFLDRGKTQRRHIIVKSIQHIGKEANKLDEQIATGYDPDAQTEYGICPEQKDEMLQSVLQAITTYGAKNIAVASKLSERYVLKIHKGKIIPSEKAFSKLQTAIKILKNTSASEQALLQKIKEMMKGGNVSIRSVATKLEMDAANLRKILSGLRSSKEPLIRVHAYLMELTAVQN